MAGALGSSLQSNFQFLNLADTGNLFITKRLMELAEVFLQVIKIIALRLMIRVVAQVTQEASVGFLPVCEPRFYGRKCLISGRCFPVRSDANWAQARGDSWAHVGHRRWRRLRVCVGSPS